MNKLFILLLLTACDRPLYDEPDYNAQLSQACANMGAPQGSPQYYDCRISILKLLATENRPQYITPNNAPAFYKLRGTM